MTHTEAVRDARTELSEIIEALEGFRDALDGGRTDDRAEDWRQITASLEAYVEPAVISALRSQGLTWEALGEVYGISRQGAQQRWGALGGNLA